MQFLLNFKMLLSTRKKIKMKKFIKELLYKGYIKKKDDEMIPESSEVFGPHVMVDGTECDNRALRSLKFVYKVLDELPGYIGMTKMTLPQVVFWKDKWAKSPGVSGFVMIAESHISIHTFPDDDYVFIDVFSCKNFDTKKAAKYIIDAFKIKKATVNTVKRGLDFPVRYPPESEPQLKPKIVSLA